MVHSVVRASREIEDLHHHIIPTNGVRLHVVEAGQSDGPLVILLHGFPEYWRAWRYQIPFLAQAGYRVWVPDQRGYNLSDKPHGLGAYGLDELTQDVVGLIRAADQGPVYLVGHDWGAAVAWWVAQRYPALLRRLVILNVPHPTVMQRMLRRSLAQLRRSWYMFFFQLPWLPEVVLRSQNWEYAARALQRTSRPGTFSDVDLAHYRQAWSQPGAITAMLNWYRAAVRRPPVTTTSIRITVPTLMIWGARDVALGRELVQPSIDLCDDGKVVFFENATHWIQHEEAAQVNRLIASFFGSRSPTIPIEGN